MVNITKEGSDIVIEVKGFHKLWAFKNRLTIPVQHIAGAYMDEAEAGHIAGMRAPGTSIPFVINAGTFYTHEGKVFMDVMDAKKAIIIQLHDEHYQKLIVEVEDPEAAVWFLNQL